MSKFAIGKMVIAKAANKPSDPHPIGNSIQRGECGVIEEGPQPAWNGGRVQNHWGVRWADNRDTWSAEEALLVIEDPDAMQAEQQSATLETVC